MLLSMHFILQPAYSKAQPLYKGVFLYPFPLLATTLWSFPMVWHWHSSDLGKQSMEQKTNWRIKWMPVQGTVSFGGNWHSISWTKIARHAFTLFVNTIKTQGSDSEIPTCLVYKFHSLPLHHMNTLDHILREICMASHKWHEQIRKRQEFFPPPTSLPAFTVKGVRQINPWFI